VSELPASDARSLSGEARQALRERGAHMLSMGHTHAQVAAAMGVAVRTVATWSARLRVGGFEGLTEGRRGRRPVEQMALTLDQQAQVVRAMAGSNPDQLELGEGVLWSRPAVRALITRLFGVVLSRQTVGVYLRRWGWTAKKPQKRWAEQDADRVKAWVQDEYPKIKARAAKEGAIVLFCDEMGVRAGQTAGTSYAPVGQRAVVKLTGKRFGANVISAIGADGTLLFDVFEGTCDDVRFLDFADKLLAQLPDRSIFLILDNASFHKSAAVKCWQQDNPRLQLFYQPPYAPEINPDEYLNNDVHAHVARRRPSTLTELVALTIDYLRTRTAQIVANYFKAPHVSYAQ